LVFVPDSHLLTPAQERAYYDLHENSLLDEGYRKFLNRCAEPLLARLPPGSHGLDFGCGPAPLLAKILTESGHSVDIYDINYADDASVLAQDFDFIAATEVVEHLRNPGDELRALWSRLNPGGLLAIMTKLVASPERFANWHYIRDPTHICFFSESTFNWLAAQWNAELELVGSDVIILRKSGVHAK
jgi:SAM-dependent methyltransferase